MDASYKKKRQGVKNGRVHATNWSNQQTEVGVSGTKGDLGNSYTFLFKASPSQKALSCEGNINHTPKGQREALVNEICDRSDWSTQLGEPVNKEIKTAHLPCDKKHASSTKKFF